MKCMCIRIENTSIKTPQCNPDIYTVQGREKAEKTVTKAG